VTAAVEVRGLAYTLPGDGRTLVQNVSFTVGLGETLVLLGRSGSGKTTTLKLINRLLEPTAGEVLVAGERTAALEPTRLRRRIGYVMQEVGLFPHFTVAQNVGLVPRLERALLLGAEAGQLPGHAVSSGNSDCNRSSRSSSERAPPGRTIP